MNTMRLIPMSQYILEHPASNDYEWQLRNHLNYANFLQQPLTLGMFVPCNESGEVLEEPVMYKAYIEGRTTYGEHLPLIQECKVFHEAKENVMFEGWKYFIQDDKLWLTDAKNTLEFWTRGSKRQNIELMDGVFVYCKIEDCTGLDLTLTNSAITKIFV